jgi:hypothetical protein
MTRSPRNLGPRERRELLRAIGAGRVQHTPTGEWRRTGGQGTYGIAAGGRRPPKVAVARRHLLDQLVDDGLVVLGPDDVWQLTHAGGLHAPAGAA